MGAMKCLDYAFLCQYPGLGTQDAWLWYSLGLCPFPLHGNQMSQSNLGNSISFLLRLLYWFLCNFVPDRCREQGRHYSAFL